MGALVPLSATGQDVPASQWLWPAAPAPLQQATSGHIPGTVALLSLGLPGAGQHAMGQNRKWVYLALETVGWAFFLERRGAGGDLRDEYRSLAWDRARAQTGPRVDGDFGYYETLTKWTSSGVFDSDPLAAGLQPEGDASTFNGSVWALSQQIFLPSGTPINPDDPAYLSALNYYRDRAYGEAFLWDWSGSPGAQQEFSDLISDSDDRFRQATTAVGLVIANHLVSAADAFLAARGVQPPARIRLVRRTSPGQGWQAVVSVPLPR